VCRRLDRHGESQWPEAGLEPVEGVEEVGRPWPGGVKAEAAGTDVGGDVEEPVADGLGRGSPERADQADTPRPAQQVVRTEGELHPAVVVGGRVEGQAGEPAGFGVPDDLLGPALAAVPQVEGGQVGAVGVGDERGVALANGSTEAGGAIERVTPSSTRLAPTTASVVIVRSQTLTELGSPLELRFSRSTGPGKRAQPETSDHSQRRQHSHDRSREHGQSETPDPPALTPRLLQVLLLGRVDEVLGEVANGHRSGAGVDVEQSPTRHDDLAGLLT
jgi:hypothetical protein